MTPPRLLAGFWNVSNRLQLTLASGVCLLLLLEIASYWSAAHLQASNDWVEHTYAVLTRFEKLDTSLTGAESACRAYLQTGHAHYWADFESDVDASRRMIKELIGLTADNGAQQRNLHKFENGFEAEVQTLREATADRDKGDTGGAERLLSTPQYNDQDNAINDLLSGMREAEHRLLAEREATTQQSERHTFLLISGATFVAILMALAGGTSIRSSLRLREAAVEATEHARALNASILNTVQDGIYGVDTSGNAIFVNAGAATLTGWTVVELLGKPIHTMIHALNEDGTPHDWSTCPLRRSLAGGSIERATHEVFTRRDDSHFAVDFTSVPQRDSRGGITGAVVTFRDITAAREVQTLKDQFISMVSHELRTPLTSIRGSLGLLASGKLGQLMPKGQHMLDIAVNNTDRLVRLINDILDLERMEAGKVSMERRAVAADQLLRLAAESVGGLADKAGVTLKLDVEFDGNVWADTDRIVQTLTNLLGNALKFSPRDTTITLGCRSNGTLAIFSVRDQGRGIPQDKLDRIFDRFQQVDSSDAREKGGTGLGLAICRLIVHQHGGQIWVESKLHEGSSFFFTVPLARVDHQPEHASPARPLVALCGHGEAALQPMAQSLIEQGYDTLLVPGLDGLLDSTRVPAVILLHLELIGDARLDTLRRTPTLQNVPVIWFNGVQGGDHPDPPLAEPVAHDEETLLRALSSTLHSPDDAAADVLIVEDDSDLAAVLSAMFSRQGIRTHRASSGRSAIRLMAEMVPDLIVLDLVMPEGNGFEVLEWLRQQDRLTRTTLLVYTAKDLSPEDMARLGRHNTEVFTKSRISPGELEKYVLAALGHTVSQTSQ